MSERRNEDERRADRDGADRRMGDRRDSHRLSISVEVKVGNGDFEARAGNVGIGGVYFDKPLSLPTGAVVQIRFELPEMNKTIESRAEVVEITSVGAPGTVGTRVKFKDLDLRSELLIARFLDSHKDG